MTSCIRSIWQLRIDYQMRPDADPQQVGCEDVVRHRINGQLGRVASPSEYDIVWVGP